MSMRDEHIPTVMPTTNRSANIGATLNDDTSRLEAIAKVTGAARFSRDVYLPNSLFVSFIRCPYGAAKLESIDTEAATAVQGVLDVQMSRKRGQYHGQPAGYLVADSPSAMWRGLRALNAQWKPQPVKTGITDEISGPPPVPPSVQSLLDEAENTLDTVYTTQVQTHASAETHGSVVDHHGDTAILYTSTQGTFAARDGMEEAFGIPLSAIEVRCEHVGGGFGSKLRAGKESLIAARVSAKYKRPVYLFVSRAEDHLDTGNRPSSRTYVNIGFNSDGTILGGRMQSYGGVGVGGNGGVHVPSGRYSLGELARDHTPVRFNGGAERPFRAPGAPQGAFVEELMLDEIAAITGVNPLDLRLARTTHDDFREMFTLGAEHIGWSSRAATGSQKGTIRRGFGIGSGSWERYPARAEAEVVINRDGSVEARTGTQDIGTGNRTVMAVVTADRLGIPLRNVSVRLGNSTLPIGPASGGSMTVHNVAPAMMQAADDAKNQLLALLADRLDAASQDLDIVSGEIRRGDETLMTWSQACVKAVGQPIVGRGNRTQGVARYGGAGHSRGVQFVELAVDVETGIVRVKRIVAIQVCGRVMCRKTAENQVMGAVTQGISYALFEDRILDHNLGSMVNPNLDMYKIIGTADIPHIEPIFYTKGQTGPRSLGEPPTIPTAGAIACAVYNAIGVPVRDLPITPDKILAALEGDAA
ncbi:MAG: xanthine dehydrogenase family protein molybdopterin-binding subunit [Phycisphaerales bacterium]|nr:xanthine dehydrogenase family protein molybdopterin-binding subunit [Phycisphaerales bacterium]